MAIGTSIEWIGIEHNAAVCDGAGNAQQAAHHVVRFFERMIKDPQAQVADPATWMSWVLLMDSQRLGGTQSTFVGVAVPDEKARLPCPNSVIAERIPEL
jgi:hypothetical protein